MAGRTIDTLGNIGERKVMEESQCSRMAPWHRTSFRMPGATSSFLHCVAALLLPISVLSADPPVFEYVELRLINGPCCTDAGTDLVVDDEGNVLVAGMRGSLDFNRDGVIDMPTFGSPDVFISKIGLVEDSNVDWARGPGGPKADQADGIASDHHGGVYAVGMFTDSMRMNETTTLRSEGGSDGFVARYGRDSKLMWGRAIGGTGEDRILDVASDSNGNVISIGVFGGPVDADRDGKIDLDADRDGKVMVVSYSPDGEFRWARGIGGDASARGLAIATGPNDEIYIGGFYRNGAPDFDNDGKPDLPVSAETSAEAQAQQAAGMYEFNGFYARLDVDGAPLWVKGVTGPALQAISAITIAANGDLLVFGAYSAPPDFDGDGEADLEFRSIADRMWKYDADVNSFLIQVTPAGERVWTKRYTALARHIVANGSHILLSGAYSGALDVDDDGIPERESDDDEEREGFSIILDEQGEVQQVLTVVGDHHDIVNAAGFSPDGNTLYLTGFTSLGADFDGDDEIESASLCHKAGELYLAIYAMSGQD